MWSILISCAGAFQAQVFSFAPSLFNLPIAKKKKKTWKWRLPNTQILTQKIEKKSSNNGPAIGIGSKITTVGQASHIGQKKWEAIGGTYWVTNWELHENQKKSTPSGTGPSPAKGEKKLGLWSECCSYALNDKKLYSPVFSWPILV
jgi:hypothetical protein